jgi:hypothetical protein
MGVTDDVRTAAAAKRLAECEIFSLFADEEADNVEFYRFEVARLEMALDRPFVAAQRATGLIELRVDLEGLAREVQSLELSRLALLRLGIFPRRDTDGQPVWASYDADVVRPSALVTFTQWRWLRGEFHPKS